MQASEEINDRQEIISSAWRDQAIWSQTANLMKTSLSGWRLCAVIAGVTGALLETLAAGLRGVGEPWSWLSTCIAIVGAVVLSVVPFITRTKTSHERVREWVRARSVSEALKETIYRFLVGAKPFGPESSASGLVKRCKAIRDKAQDLLKHTAVIQPEYKKRPLSLSIDDYVRFRVNGQIEDYYIPKGRENALAAQRLHNLEFWLGMLAVVFGALSAAGGKTGMDFLGRLGPWVGVVTTATAAVTAHLAAARYDYNAIAYLGTAGRLKDLRDMWKADSNRMLPEVQARFVDECEQAISSQNESWLAEWAREKK